MDKRTKKYRKKLERKLQFWYKLALGLLGFALVSVLYGILMTVKSHADSKHYEVLSPVVSWELKNDKNQFCLGEYEQMFCNGAYDWDFKTMIAIARCESRLNPEAMALEPNGTWSGGILQVNSVHGYKPSEVFGAKSNIDLGYKVFLSQGYEAWSVYGSNCFYKELASL